MMKSCLLTCLLSFTSLLFSYNALADKSALIAAGSFNMGCSVGDSLCEKDEATKGGVSVHVKKFRIDTYEVSVGEYQQCVKQRRCQTPDTHQKNKYCNYGANERKQHPVNCIDWQHALEYCQWKGGRLPYEAEWEKAARGGSKTAYPWGSKVNCKQAIVDDGKTFGSVPDEPDGCGEDRTWPVGSRKANAFGLYDMHGNAGEWTANWYAPEAIEKLYAKSNLAGPERGRQKVVRGGSWDENTGNLRSSYRNTKRPVSGESIYGSIGFRCVYDSANK